MPNVGQDSITTLKQQTGSLKYDRRATCSKGWDVDRQCFGTPCLVGSEGSADQFTCCTRRDGRGGLPFWLAYVIVAVVILLICCCVLLYLLLCRKSNRHWYEFEPRTQKVCICVYSLSIRVSDWVQHVDQISEYTRTRVTSDVDDVDLSEVMLGYSSAMPLHSPTYVHILCKLRGCHSLMTWKW